MGPTWDRSCPPSAGSSGLVRNERRFGDHTEISLFAADSALAEAEGAGFEPADELPRLRFSRPVHSTTLPPLRGSECRWSARAAGGPDVVELGLVEREQPAFGDEAALQAVQPDG
jgi:hypothetical protein